MKYSEIIAENLSKARGGLQAAPNATCYRLKHLAPATVRKPVKMCAKSLS
jgi:hypothetical protein